MGTVGLISTGRDWGILPQTGPGCARAQFPTAAGSPSHCRRSNRQALRGLAPVGPREIERLASRQFIAAESVVQDLPGWPHPRRCSPRFVPHAGTLTGITIRITMAPARAESGRVRRLDYCLLEIESVR